jgi:hypothetical protein
VFGLPISRAVVVWIAYARGAVHGLHTPGDVPPQPAL